MALRMKNPPHPGGGDQGQHRRARPFRRRGRRRARRNETAALPRHSRGEWRLAGNGRAPRKSVRRSRRFLAQDADEFRPRAGSLAGRENQSEAPRAESRLTDRFTAATGRDLRPKLRGPKPKDRGLSVEWPRYFNAQRSWFRGPKLHARMVSYMRTIEKAARAVMARERDTSLRFPQIMPFGINRDQVSEPRRRHRGQLLDVVGPTPSSLICARCAASPPGYGNRPFPSGVLALHAVLNLHPATAYEKLSRRGIG